MSVAHRGARHGPEATQAEVHVEPESLQALPRECVGVTFASGGNVDDSVCD